MMVYIWIRCTGTVMYRIDLVDHTSSIGTGSQYPIRLTVSARRMTNSMRQCVLNRLRTVEYSTVSLHDAAERTSGGLNAQCASFMASKADKRVGNVHHATIPNRQSPNCSPGWE